MRRSPSAATASLTAFLTTGLATGLATGLVTGLVTGGMAGGASAATSPAAAPATVSAAILAAESIAATSKIPRGILVYGDSLALGVAPHAAAAFRAAGLPAPTVMGRVGLRASAGLAYLRSRCSQLPSTVILSLGTNDFWLSSTAAEGWVNSLESCAGPNRTIIWVNTYLSPRLSAYSGYRNINNGLLRAAAKLPNVYVIDWASFVSKSAVHLKSDGVHPDAAGYQKRADLLANAALIG